MALLTVHGCGGVHEDGDSMRVADPPDAGGRRNGGTDTAMVVITVTDVAEDLPPAPAGLSVTLARMTSVTWLPQKGLVDIVGRWVAS